MTTAKDIATLTQTAVQNSACLTESVGRLAVQDAEVEDQQPEEQREEADPDEFDHRLCPA